MPDGPDVFASLANALKGELARARDTLVPPAFQFLWEPARYTVAYGGRASAKSWSIARVLLVLAHEGPQRVLCLREVQNSIKESAYRLLCDQVDMLGLRDFYQVQADCIIGRNDSRFFFEGLRYNTSRIRSYEGITTVWVEEAQSVSDLSWEDLLPTIRKTGSRFFISFNPVSQDDPVQKRFVDVTPPMTIARKVSYLDNPHLSAESESERLWLQQTDPDAYRHVWEGEPRTVSDAQIFRNKFTVETFDIDPAWAGPYHGVDFGFSKDPSAGIRCHIDDINRVLYVSREFWRLACDIDALPSALEEAIPELSRHTVYCDNSRPETISFLQRHGIPNARPAEKWPGSVDDGVMYLRSFAKIVIAPECVHTIDEFRSYSFKIDRLNGQPLPQVEDKHNHLVDALRYSIHTLIRNQAPGGYFSRSALLVGGEPAEISKTRPNKIFGVLVSTERPGTAAALVVFVQSTIVDSWPLTVLDHELVEIDTALSIQWLDSIYTRMREFKREWHARDIPPELWIETSQPFGQAVWELAWQDAQRKHGMPAHLINVAPIEKDDSLPLTLDQRANEARTIVNGGKYVKLARSAYLPQSTFRSSTTNHFCSQVFGYRPDARDAAQELVHAFCTGILASKTK